MPCFFILFHFFCCPHNYSLTRTICNVCGCLALVLAQRKASAWVFLSEWNMPRRNRVSSRSAGTSAATWQRCGINYALAVSSCPPPISHFLSLTHPSLFYSQTNNILKPLFHESLVPNLSQSRWIWILTRVLLYMPGFTPLPPPDLHISSNSSCHCWPLIKLFIFCVWAQKFLSM